ncbi:MAG: hypothetical protein K2Q45_06570 [Nitrosomonas sp.]|nr:hypothetical protein [Nitrosomonas sp.]
MEPHLGLLFCGQKCQYSFIEGKREREGESETELEANIKKITALSEMFENTRKFLNNNTEIIIKTLVNELEEFFNINLTNDLAKGNVELAKYILDKDLYSIDDISYYIAASNNVDAMQLLLDYKADPKQSDSSGDNLIQYLFDAATIDGYSIPELTLLIEKLGVDLNHESLSGFTMFEKALLDANYVHVDVIKYMLDQGAKIRPKTLTLAFQNAERNANNTNDFVNYKKIIALLVQRAPEIDLMRRVGKSRNFFSDIQVPKLRMFLLQLIVRQRNMGKTPMDVSKILNATKLRNYLCNEISDGPGDYDTDQKQYLLLFIKMLGVPKDVSSIWKNYPVAKLCSYLSTILAIGAIWDDEKFLQQREAYENLKKYELNRAKKFIETFKEGLENMFGIRTDGKSLETLIEEFEDI